MAKVLFINPVVREEDVPRHIPYGIALLAAIAQRDGHLVQVYDANAWRQGWDVLEQVCDADDWDVVAIGGLTTTYRYIKKACRIIRAKLPKVRLVAGAAFSPACRWRSWSGCRRSTWAWWERLSSLSRKSCARWTRAISTFPTPWAWPIAMPRGKAS